MRIESGFFVNSVIFVIFLIFSLKNIKNCNKIKFLILFVFYLYIINLIKYAFLPISIDSPIVEVIYSSFSYEEHFNQNVNFIPFIRHFNWKDFILNIIMTIPLGIFLPLLVNKINNKKVIVIGLLTGLTIESYQFLLFFIEGYFSRSININDLISNFIGVLFGYCLFSFSINAFVGPKSSNNGKLSNSLYFQLLDKGYKF